MSKMRKNQITFENVRKTDYILVVNPKQPTRSFHMFWQDRNGDFNYRSWAKSQDIKRGIPAGTATEMIKKYTKGDNKTVFTSTIAYLIMERINRYLQGKATKESLVDECLLRDKQSDGWWRA